MGGVGVAGQLMDYYSADVYISSAPLSAPATSLPPQLRHLHDPFLLSSRPFKPPRDAQSTVEQLFLDLPSLNLRLWTRWGRRRKRHGAVALWV